MTKPPFEETLIEVWRQALVENLKAVKVGGESYPVRRTPKRGLRRVDFTFDGHGIRGLDKIHYFISEILTASVRTHRITTTQLRRKGVSPP